MIIAGTIASAAVQGVTTTGPGDVGPATGMSPVGINGKWQLSTGENFAISALGTVTTAANLDCTVAGYFTLTGTAGNACAVTFGTGSSTGAFSCQLGQVVQLRVTGSGATVNTLTWTGYTIAWVGTLTGTGGSSQSAPVLVASKLANITLVCTGTGSTPTFDGSYTIGT